MKRESEKMLFLLTILCIVFAANSSAVLAKGISSEKSIYRVESDSLGKRKISNNNYYGVQTIRAVENFPITDVPLSRFPYFIKALAMVKRAAAMVNKKQGTVDSKTADAIIEAAKEVEADQFNDQFPVDMIQGGAGTSANMNVNEVIANRALEILGYQKGNYRYLHPNNHVNASQSTNDVYPTAGKMAIIWYCQDLIPDLEALRDSFYKKSLVFRDTLKIGRTHLQDAVPMTLGQEFNAFSVTLDKEINYLKRAMTSLYAVNMGATAIGTGINTKLGYSKAVIHQLAELSNLPLVRDRDLIESTSDAGGFVRVADALKSIALKLTKISNDLRLLSSGPQAGFGDIKLPAVQPGSTIMPGKSNPVIPEVVNQVCFQVLGYSEVVDMAAFSGQLQLNVFEPVVFYDIMQSTILLKRAAFVLKTKCVDGIVANEDWLNEKVQNFAGLVTALSPYIGYAKAAEIAKEAQKSDKTVLEILKASKLIKPAELEKLLKPAAMTSPNVPKGKKIEKF